MALAALTVKIGADLSDLNKGLTDANRSVQTFGAGVSRNVTAPIQGMTAAATGAGTSFKALREPLTGVTRQLLQLNPAVAQVSSVLGTLAIGSGPMIAVLAGVAALSVGWHMLTKDARELKKETDEAIKSLTNLRDKQRLGPLAGTGAREAEKAGTRLFFLQEELGQLRGVHRTQAAVGGGQETAKKIAKLEEEERDLRSLIQAHENEVAEVRKAAAEKRLRDQEAAAEKEYKTWQEAFARRIDLIKSSEDTLSRIQRETSEGRTRSGELSALGIVPGAGHEPGAAGGPLAGFKFIPSMFAQVTTLQLIAAGKLKEAADAQKAAADEAKRAALQDYALSQVTSLLSQHGGVLGGVAAGAISGAMATGGNPIGAVIGGGVALISSLFGQRKAVDRNTEAVNRLTETLQNAPSGFKVAPYQFAASQPQAMPRQMTPAPVGNPWALARWLAEQNDTAAQRGGTVAAYG